jgi:hypothetical protein
MKMNKIIAIMSILFVSVAVQAAQTGPLLWTVDSEHVSGSFVYNDIDFQYTDVSLFVDPPGVDFVDFEDVGAVDGLGFRSVDTTDFFELDMSFFSTLNGAAAGDVVEFDSIVTGPPTFNGCQEEVVDSGQDCGPWYSGGTITASEVPIPAAAWLFGSGLVGLVGMARRKQSKA